MMWKCEKGQAILEFAIVSVIFVGIGLGMADFLWAQTDAANMSYIVNEVSRCQAISAVACTAPNTPTSYALQMAANLRLPPPNFKIVSVGCDGVYCTMTATYSYHALGYYFPSIVIFRKGMAAVPPSLGP